MAEARRALVVDDDRDLRETVADVLGMDGWAVEQAADGREALDRLRDPSAPRPSLILLDMMMPGMNGWQFLEQKKGDPALAPIAVVLMTASSIDESKRERDGFVAWLRKPFQLDYFLSVVRQVDAR